MATATLPHGYNPALVAQHLGAPALFITRQSDYLFDVDCGQAALDAAIVAAQSGMPPMAQLQAVSKYQLRTALREQGRLQAFNTYITSLADGTFVREKWENGSGMFGFNKPWCDAVKAGLGLTTGQMRALWRSAQAVNEDE